MEWTSYAQQLLYGVVIPAGLTALVGILVAKAPKLVHAVIVRFETATNIDISDDLEAKITALCIRGVNATEEAARRLLKEKSEKMTGDAKLNMAMDVVKKGLTNLGVNVPDDEELKDRIHDIVNATRGLEEGKSLGESD